MKKLNKTEIQVLAESMLKDLNKSNEKINIKDIEKELSQRQDVKEYLLIEKKIAELVKKRSAFRSEFNKGSIKKTYDEVLNSSSAYSLNELAIKIKNRRVQSVSLNEVIGTIVLAQIESKDLNELKEIVKNKFKK